MQVSRGAPVQDACDELLLLKGNAPKSVVPLLEAASEQVRSGGVFFFAVGPALYEAEESIGLQVAFLGPESDSHHHLDQPEAGIHRAICQYFKGILLLIIALHQQPEGVELPDGRVAVDGLNQLQHSQGRDVQPFGQFAQPKQQRQGWQADGGFLKQAFTVAAGCPATEKFHAGREVAVRHSQRLADPLAKCPVGREQEVALAQEGS